MCDETSAPRLFNVSQPHVRVLLQTLETVHLFYTHWHGLVGGAICASGVLTNIAHLAVLRRAGVHLATVRAPLAAIAVCDLLTCLTSFVYLVRFKILNDPNRVGFAYGWLVFLMIHVVGSIALHTVSLYLSVWIAWARQAAMGQLKMHGIRRARTNRYQTRHHGSALSLRWVLAAVAGGVSLVSIPTLLVHRIERVELDPEAGMESQQSAAAVAAAVEQQALYTVGMVDISDEAGCRLFRANLWLIGVAFKAIPCTLLTILTLRLVCRLYAAASRRSMLLSSRQDVTSTSRNMSSILPNKGRMFSLGSSYLSSNGVHKSSDAASSPQLLDHNGHSSPNNSRLSPNLKKPRRQTAGGHSADRTTAVLTAMLLVFVATELPQGLLAILNAIYPWDVHSYVYLNVGELLDLLSLINANLGFLLCAALSASYRAAARSLFCGFLGEAGKSSTSVLLAPMRMFSSAAKSSPSVPVDSGRSLPSLPPPPLPQVAILTAESSCSQTTPKETAAL